MTNYQGVLSFWFDELGESKWWVKDEKNDALIKTRFMKLYVSATKGELYHWRVKPKGRLAEIIILDQFPRNMFRDNAQAFASDSMALALSQEAIAKQADNALSALEKSFLYMPFMHSESLKMHILAIDLYTRNGLPTNLEFEIKHKEIIDKFGRYPHRNAVLGRQSTEEEVEFLKQSDSSF